MATFRIIGADGRQYGPITLEQLSQWISEGRVNAQTQVQEAGAADWKPAGEIPEFQEVFQRLRSAVPPDSAPAVAPAAASPGQQRTGLAITSLVLGILSLFCFGPLAAIPAIICGHIAYSRARKNPAEFGGSGLAIAGFATGYVGLFVTLLILPAMLLPALARAKSRAQEINCVNNMKQIGLALRTWALDHNDQFPFNVKTNAGGTLELCATGPDGFDRNTAMHLLVLSNELSTPRILVCPADKKQTALDFQHLQSLNVTYQLRTGESITDTNPQEVLAVCPIHHNTLHVDGSVQRGRTGRLPRGQPFGDN